MRLQPGQVRRPPAAVRSCCRRWPPPPRSRWRRRSCPNSRARRGRTTARRASRSSCEPTTSKYEYHVASFTTTTSAYSRTNALAASTGELNITSSLTSRSPRIVLQSTVVWDTFSALGFGTSYVITSAKEVTFSSLSVCYQVCAKTYKWICMKFSGKVSSGPLNKWLNFSGDQIRDPDPHHDTGKTCLGEVCTVPVLLVVFCLSLFTLTCIVWTEVNILIMFKK